MSFSLKDEDSEEEAEPKSQTDNSGKSLSTILLLELTRIQIS